MGKTCEVCGKPSGMYPLCKECLQLKTQNLVIKCPKCGKWRYSDRPCTHCGDKEQYLYFEYSKTKKNYSEKKVEFDFLNSDSENLENANNIQLTCIICGKNSNGKHFCPSCYAKFKNRSVDIRITNCQEVTILDEYGNKKIKCDDGRYVRSRAEALISNFLFNNKVRAIYEKEIFYDDEGTDKVLKPDFYLPDYEIYIEYNELKNEEYLKSKKYSEKIYQQLGYKVIIMGDTDLENIPAFLKPKLKLH